MRDNPEYLEIAVDYFSSKWRIARQIYFDCISHSLTTESPLPRWFLMLKGDIVIGCYGLITNDFISRQDLMPWLCALYVEKDFRGSKLGSKLLGHGIHETEKLGFKKAYISTDHTGYYEKYGWSYIGNGYGVSGEEARIYEYIIK